MTRFFPIIRRLFSGGAVASAGFIASVAKWGISVANRFTLLATEVKPAIAFDATRQGFRGPTQNSAVASSLLGVSGTAVVQITEPAIQSTASLRSVAAASVQVKPAFSFIQSLRSILASSFPVQPALATSLIGVSGTAIKPTVNPAFQMAARISEFHLDAKPACNIVQVVYDLARRVGANVGSGTFTNPTGAQSAHNGTTATSAGGAAGGSRTLTLGYSNHVNKGELAITQAKLFLYAAVTGDGTGLLSSTLITYNIGAGAVTLETIAGNFSNLTTPREYDISAALNTWTEYDALSVVVTHTYQSASVGVSCAVDACEVDVLANKTDTL